MTKYETQQDVQKDLKGTLTGQKYTASSIASR